MSLFYGMNPQEKGEAEEEAGLPRGPVSSSDCGTAGGVTSRISSAFALSLDVGEDSLTNSLYPDPESPKTRVRSESGREGTSEQAQTAKNIRSSSASLPSGSRKRKPKSSQNFSQKQNFKV